MTMAAIAGLLVDNVDNSIKPIQWISHIYMGCWAQCYKPATKQAWSTLSILSTIALDFRARRRVI